ncbi:MAG TPA: DUF359 domain-containing protein [Candidatus Micrarchaeota archaeon]|nr:DUF359 domain-containing protein [Candidatus Micrarchaeota archaeon]
MYIITDELRAALKEPLGALLPDAGLRSRLKSGGWRVCAVGDECAYRLIRSGIIPEIIIYDTMTKRSAVSGEVSETLSSFCKSPQRVKNPAGTITRELEDAVKSVMSAGKGCILVDGEEDLATLIVMQCASEKWAVVYGQPDKGAVLVIGGARAKAAADGALAKFARE